VEWPIDMSRQEVKLSDIGVSEEVMEKYMVSLETGVGDSSRHVCICGHLLNRHVNAEANPYCSFGKSLCLCSEPIAVIEAEDLRFFGYSTTGLGKKHALRGGLFAHNRRGKSARWLIERECFKCNQTGVPLLIASLGRQRRVTQSSGQFNALLCSNCLYECGGSWEID